MQRLAVLLVAALIVLMSGGALAGKTTRQLPAKYRKKPYSRMSLSVGHPNSGWQRRSMKLRHTRYLSVKRGSRARSWGHPALVKMLRRNARDIARSVRGSIMLVGDLSRRHGGPLAGHHSHQSGRDADVAFYATNRRGKPVRMRKFVAFDGDGNAKDNSGLRFDDRRNWLLVRAWMRDHRAGLSHVFVSWPLRTRLLDYARKLRVSKKVLLAAAVLLKRPKNASAHDDHFHVRIACPKGQGDICKEHPIKRR